MQGESDFGKGWYLPRSLPHFDAVGLWQAITFRLADSLPSAVVAARAAETRPDRSRRLDAALDAGFGSCLLRDPAAAAEVEAALLFGVGERYDLAAWVVMPNHVHALIVPRLGYPLATIVQGWKSWTAKRLNGQLRTTGRVWQKEYFDRFMRDERHALTTVAYIEQNPVKAGLVDAPENWRFGSAWWAHSGALR